MATFSKDFIVKNGLQVSGTTLQVGAIMLKDMGDNTMNVYESDGVTLAAIITPSSNVSYDNSASGLTATNVKAALDELKAAILGQDSAAEITYSNTSSGLTAATIQAAIDEIVAEQDTNTKALLADLDGNIIPSADITYDLGSPTKQWRDLYIGPGSLYLNGTKVLEDNAGTLNFSADANQSMTLQTSGTGQIDITSAAAVNISTTGVGTDISLTAPGNVEINSDLLMLAGKAINTSNGSAVTFAVDADFGANSITATTVTANLTGNVTGTVSSLSNHDTADLAEGTNLYYTNARARGAISVTDTGGDGSLAYNSTTGVLTYTGPSAAEVQAHISTDATLTYSSGQISMPASGVTAGSYGAAAAVPVITVDAQGRITSATTTAVAGVSSVTYTASSGVLQIDTSDGSSYTNDLGIGTSDSPTFAGLTVNGDLIVSGTTTTINTETVNIADNQIVLNSNYTGSTPTENGGIEIERGTLANKTFVWDETSDKWTVGSEAMVAGTFEGNLTGNVTGTVSTLSNHDTADLAEGTNQYFTTARARASISASGDLTYNSTTGVVSFTERTDSEVQGLISVTDAGGFGAISKSGGTITYTGISTEEIQDVVGGMVSTNTENGVVVTYDDTNGKLNFDVNDPTITLSGDVTGSATMTNLGNVSITATVANDSHTHDGRYYTETESDARFAPIGASANTGTTNTFTEQQTFQKGFINENPFNYVGMHVDSNATLTALSGYQIKSGSSTIIINSGVTLTIASGAEVAIG